MITKPRMTAIACSRLLAQTSAGTAWRDDLLLATLRAWGPRDILLTDGDTPIPRPVFDAHARAVRYATEGRVERFENDGGWVDTSRTDERWYDAATMTADAAGRWLDARAEAMVQAARKAYRAGWLVDWLLLLHTDDPEYEPCRVLDRLTAHRAPGIVRCYEPAVEVPITALVDRVEGAIEEAQRAEDDAVWIDVETSGRDVQRHAMVEIAAVRTDRRHAKVLATFERKIKLPAWAELDPEAVAVCGYTPEAWADAPDEATVIRELAAWLPARWTLGGYSVSFDRRFVAAAFERQGLPEPGWRAQVVDPLPKARQILKKLGKVENCQLSTLRRYYGIETGTAHRAMADAETARQVYLRLVGGGLIEEEATP